MRSSIFLLAGACVLAGCGGSGGDGARSSPGASTVHYGPLSLEGFVSGSPVIANGSGASMVGLTGTFTAVTLVNPNPTIDQSQIAFAEDNRLFLRAMAKNALANRPPVNTSAVATSSAKIGRAHV